MDDQVDLFRRNIPRAIIDLIPASVARECRIVPLELDAFTLVVATVDVEDRENMDKLRFILNREVRLVAASRSAIDYAIERYYA